MSGKLDPLVQDIVDMHKSGNYRDIIEQLKEVIHCDERNKLHLVHLLSWPTPTEQSLEELAADIYSLRISHIYSICCGTGLLEWLLSQFLLKHYKESDEDYAKRIELTGVESDFRWWASPYAPPQFIPLQFVGKDFAAENPFGDFDDMAMFCYFSSAPKLHTYLNAFLGSHVIIIGPIQTQQQYFVSNNNEEECADVELTEIFKLPKADWKLILLKQFGLIKTDHVAIYRRIEKSFVPVSNKRYVLTSSAALGAHDCI